MTNREYELLATDIVIGYAKEQRVKLLRSDFTNIQKADIMHVAKVTAINSTEEDSVFVKLFYKGKNGKQLKAVANNFLNYIYARVLGEYIYFCFSYRELDVLNLKNGGADEASEEALEKVIKRINKLLELGDLSKNNSEAEAISASMKAQQLLAKYNLDIVDITGEGDRNKGEIQQVVCDTTRGKIWQEQLALVIANSYRCKTFLLGKDKIVFYGYEADILIARRVFVYLFNVGDKLAKQVVREHKEEYGVKDGVYNSFCRGFLQGVKSELEKNCKALALVVSEDVETSYAVMMGNAKTKKNKPVSNLDRDTYEKGRIEGKRALNAQYIEGE